MFAEYLVSLIASICLCDFSHLIADSFSAKSDLQISHVYNFLTFIFTPINCLTTIWTKLYIWMCIFGIAHLSITRWTSSSEPCFSQFCWSCPFNKFSQRFDGRFNEEILNSFIHNLIFMIFIFCYAVPYQPIQRIFILVHAPSNSFLNITVHPPFQRLLPASRTELQSSPLFLHFLPRN